MAKKSVESQQCNCLEQVQEQLKEHNTTIVQSLQINFKTGKGSLSNPRIAVQKINSKSKKPAIPILCAHCPFCGKKYPE